MTAPDASTAPGHTIPPTPGDIARWAFWVPFRNALNPAKPHQLRRLYGLWPGPYALAGEKRALMLDEYRRCFGELPEAPQLVQEAYRISFQTHLEELLLGKLDAQTWRNYMVLEGEANIQAALDRGKGALLLLPHAGAIMMLIAAVSLGGYTYTQYAARGLPPAEMAAEHPELIGHNPWREAVRLTREANEDRLPATFLTMTTNARALYRCLERNELVGIAYDGRIGNRFELVSYLGREALLNPGPYKLALSTGAAIIPTFCVCPPKGPNVAHFGAPIFPETVSAKKGDHRPLMAAFIEAITPWIWAHKAEYGPWLAHCRHRAPIDDHPLFIDYAPDDRWKKYA